MWIREGAKSMASKRPVPKGVGMGKSAFRAFSSEVVSISVHPCVVSCSKERYLRARVYLKCARQIPNGNSEEVAHWMDNSTKMFILGCFCFSAVVVPACHVLCIASIKSKCEKLGDVFFF
ncbi:hypothetical protein BDW60DRAFT_7389 [Aspergillus nidulans var. acristatus]